MDPIVKNPITVKVLSLMLALSLLLALASAPIIFPSGISLFIGLLSLAVTAASIAVVATDLHDKLAKQHFFQMFSPDFEVRWKHIQFTYSLILASFNFMGVIINAALATWLHERDNVFSREYNHSYFTATFFSLTLFLSFLLDAILSLHMDEEDAVEKARVISKENYEEL